MIYHPVLGGAQNILRVCEVSGYKRRHRVSVVLKIWTAVIRINDIFSSFSELVLKDEDGYRFELCEQIECY